MSPRLKSAVLLVTGVVLGLVALVTACVGFAAFTVTGRELTLCRIFDDAQSRLVGSAEERRQLARILPDGGSQPLAPSLVAWRYLPVGDLVVPLPPGDWHFGRSEDALTLVSSARDVVIIGQDREADSEVLYPTVSDLLFGRIVRGADFARMSFERDLSQPCDPRAPFDRILADALLMTIKHVPQPGELQDGFRNLLPEGITFVFRNVGTGRLLVDTTFRYAERWLHLTYSLTRAELVHDVLAQLPLATRRDLVPTSVPSELLELGARARAAGF